ncbi:UBP1-associated proteins 1C isoform X2 [Jatropha curcas]|uniref:UBP1-associated proteins 1C isoform X2 n=1 Tax=Jatropha curcas TaxID=180498 RepID=UPI0005FB1B22|nr:UBP1-associated proteins 1C isoform X2 [Jatropha curcas]
MVWFQCEDCGENLKKPKLPNHFRICSASKLSCIDCGEMFGQDSVQGHTQCITEAEKYGPKGQGKAPNGATPKTNKNAKQQPDVDINVGLSERPPWFCSLCNTKATSKQTLLLHADGKKHRAKARAIHAAKQQQTKETEESTQDKPSTVQITTNGTESGKPSKKKRKLDESRSDGTGQKNGGDTTNGIGNGVVQAERTKAEEMESQLKKAKQNGLKDDRVVESGSIKEDTKKKIKLKKLIKSALILNPDGVLKMKKLKKLVLKSIQECGITEDESQFSEMLEQKINSSSRFRVDKQYVHLVAKD